MMLHNQVGTNFNPKVILLLSLTSILVSLSASPILLYPIAFTVIRQTSNSLNLTAYINSISGPTIDANGLNIGYNMVSIAGFTSSTTNLKLSTDLSPLGTWANVFSRIVGSVRNINGSTNSQIQQHILNQFHQSGSKLLMNAFSNQQIISASKADPTTMAKNIVEVLQNNNFDGVSIDFQDFNSVLNGTASPWLVTLLSYLRANLDSSKIIVLIVHPTIVPVLSLFSNQLLNSWVDVFVLKYYNVVRSDYTNYAQLFTQASKYSGTSLFELLKNSNIKMDICKTVIAKPPIPSSTFNQDTFINSNSLGTLFSQAFSQVGWFGGYANLDFGGDSSGQFQLATLNAIRSSCNRYQNCFCM